MADEKTQSNSQEQVAKRRLAARHTNIIVGLITALAITTLLWFTITVTDTTFFKSGYWLKVRFDEIVGLKEGDPVTFSGMTIGKVKYIDLVEEKKKGETRIEVTCFIEDKVRRDSSGKKRAYHIEIPRDSEFDIRSSSLLGTVALVIDRGRGLGNVYLPTPQSPDEVKEEDILPSKKPISLIQQIEGATKSINDIVSDSKDKISDSLENVKNITWSADKYMKQVNEGPGFLHDIAYDSPTSVKIRGTVDAIHSFASRLGEKTSLVDNLDSSVANLKKITDGVATGEGFLPYLLSPKSKPLVSKVDGILDDVSVLSKRLAADNSFIARVQSPEGEALFNDIREIAARIRAATGNLENSSFGRLMNDDGKLYGDISDFTESLRDLGRKVTGRGVPTEEQNSIARLLNDRGELFEDAKEGVKSLRKFMEPLARLETNVLIDHHAYNGQELGISKVGLKLIPRKSRYFYVGASVMTPDSEGPIAFDEEDQDNGRQIIFIDLLIAQHLRIIDKPDDWRNLVLTPRAGLLEGKLGGGVDLDFLKELRLTVEARGPHTDTKRFDENIDGTLVRAELSWEFMKYFRIHAGADNLLEDPDWSVGFSIEWKDEDIRALVSVAGAAS